MEGHPFRDAPQQRRIPSARVKSTSARVRDFLVMGLFTLVWNTIIDVVYISSWLEDGPVFFHIFLVLFVLAGLAMIVFTGYLFLALFNPTVELYISEPRPALGDTIDVRWHLTGKPGRVRALEVELVGSEVAIYQRGTDTTTDHHVFFRTTLVHTDVAAEIANGAATGVIPPGAVPTFGGKHNSILWKIVFKGDIPRWPDLDEDFAIEVCAGKHHRKQLAA